MTKQEKFFFDNAGFSYKPEDETRAQGKLRCAKEMAKAETWAVQNGYSFAHEPDMDADESFMDDESEEYREEWSGKAWVTLMFDAEGSVVQSLGGSYGDAKYKRVVRAELALEEMPVKVIA